MKFIITLGGKNLKEINGTVEQVAHQEQPEVSSGIITDSVMIPGHGDWTLNLSSADKTADRVISY